ncbi:MAG: hypothetical protein JWQ71_358 [Pedosphaera sp.]|nr:hypothetical protein [Pedosphaera sp.]
MMLSLRWIVCLVMVASPLVSVRAVTFTNDTVIGFNDTSYEGVDITVTNCTVTVDGAHAFASLQVLNGGNVTHTYSGTGRLADAVNVTNEIHVLTGTNAQLIAHSNLLSMSYWQMTDDTGAITYTNPADYLLRATGGDWAIERSDTSTIPDGATVLFTYGGLNVSIPTGVNLTVAGDVSVEPGGAVNVDARGYGPGGGLGSGTSAGTIASGSGGSHAGYGGLSASNAPAGKIYDSTTQPIDKGSAGGGGSGGPGGLGGGAIKLTVGGVLRVDGSISAKGANGINDRSGGGAGGSVLLTAQTFSGIGTISADGGLGEPSLGGGGGGGRIAIYYDTNTFTGSLIAHGKKGWKIGGAGTIYTKGTNDTDGQLVVDNGGLAGTNTVSTTDLMDSIPVKTGFTVKGGAVLTLSTSRTIGSLLVASNSAVTLSSFTSALTVTGNATIQAGAGIIGDGLGSVGGVGAGRGANSGGGAAGGAGYGGFGAIGQGQSAGGPVYGSIVSPVDTGSGGGNAFALSGGSGGGAIRLLVNGTLTLDGKISANGNNGTNASTGGGSGGSVWLTVGTLAGAGTISANGGTGNGFGGGGGGGRIAVVYNNTNVFTGTMKAMGAGNGLNVGGAGTIYLKGGPYPPIGQLIVDNGGRPGTNTPITVTEPFAITSSGGAVVGLSSGQTIGSLLITSNAWVAVTNTINNFLTVTGSVTIQAGGGIVADGVSFTTSGTGNGKNVNSTGGGGAYGGYGSISAAGAGTGSTYGSIVSPIDSGSTGGGGTASSQGGFAGGQIRMTVTGTLTVDGKISADGVTSLSNQGSGGGSGGSIYLTAGTFSGAGLISANGGLGNDSGGNGGGGRIALYYSTNNFTGVTRAWGAGVGSRIGGAGTVYSRTNKPAGQPPGQVVVDNGDRAGTNTPISVVEAFDLVVKGGAVVPLGGAQNIGNLLIASNAWVMTTNINNNLTITGSATIQAGGGFLADGTGSAAGQGTGAGKTLSSTSITGGGASYGGIGSYSAAGASNGPTYGSVSQPIDAGSGGGAGTSAFNGAAGGGQIHITVTGTLLVDGKISAEGNSATNPASGGGSGGSIFLTVGTLSGAGLISANGGFGADAGGSGAGGRIAIYYTSNNFTGVTRAWGAGSGSRVGGAGTIYTKKSNQNLGQVVVSNGGRTGNSTVFPTATSPSFDLTIQEGGVAGMTGSQTLGNLVVASNSTVIYSNSFVTGATFLVTGNATIQAGGRIISDGSGSAAGQGQGAGKQGSFPPSGGGGSYGGYGSTSKTGGGTGATYGLMSQPTDFGSGGYGYPSVVYGGAGGGAIHLSVTGTLTVDGRISSDGGTASTQYSGGGAGGSLWLSAGRLAGNGVISASGGSGVGAGGSGGGGRIALYYSTNDFTGTIKAWGGANGTNCGGAGTIYSKFNNQSTFLVLVDNGQQTGTNTTLGLSPGSGFDLTLQGGAIMAQNSPNLPNLRNLIVASNAWLLATGQVNLFITGSATVQAGGGIIGDSLGNMYGVGTGAGRTFNSAAYGTTGSGGGYGGLGAGSVGGAAGGGTYDVITSQQYGVGSGGGSLSASTNAGSFGGGAVHMTVIGALTNNGRISADGGAGTSSGSGGGSGGSVWLSVGSIAGTGSISANGGAGIGFGGGGGGGRIALYYNTTNNFVGSISAYGGGGALSGGAGTIYTKKNGQSIGQVLVDNGGVLGTNTPIAAMAPFNLTVRGGAVVYPSSTYLVLSNLMVASDSFLTSLQSQTNLDVSVLGDTTIEAGGGLVVDGKGFASSTGPGAGQRDFLNSTGSGAGYGGKGGASPGLLGGTNYGSAQQPVDQGSGGAAKPATLAIGSEGGGAIRLNVGGTLIVDGRLSADGNSAVQDDAGGGSGGSIWVTAGTFIGNGFVTANGGPGELYNGGGGGGGRIAIYSPSNNFGGLISAFGAEGFNWGEDGTIFFSANFGNLAVIAQTPTGVVSNGVSSVDFTFNAAINPASFSPADVIITRPDATLVTVSGITTLGAAKFRANLGLETMVGNYVINVGPQVEDYLGQPMPQVYSGAFTISLPVIQGTVTDTNGQPVAGVTVSPTGGLSLTTTDTNGNYVLGITPGWNGTVTASKNGLEFVPSYLAYTNVTTSISNQNFMAVSGIAPNVTAGLQTTNVALNWYGTSGVNYQTQYSTNLVDWLPFGNVIPGTNGAAKVLIPTDVDPKKFFRVIATY